nr:serine/threonine-protein phosphatase 7 long form homolog [Arachis hypogaea]
MAGRNLYRLNGVAHIAGSIGDEPNRCIYSVRRQQNMPMHDRIIPYLERAGLYHLARLNSQWFWLDEPLVSAFVERWRPETHTFHMPFGECTVTLQDVAFQLGLPVDGEAVSGCLGEFETYMEGGRPAWEWFEDLFGERPPPNKVKQMTVHFTWFHERFRVLPPDASEETVRIYARAYIMMLLSTQLFGDKSANRVHIRWLPFVANLDGMGRYSWGSAALAWLYRCMCRVANRNVTNLAGPLQLLQSWIFWRFPSLRPAGFEVFSFPLASRWSAYLPPNDGKEQRVIRYRLALDRLTARDVSFIAARIVWEPYSALDVLAVVHPEILTEEHSRMWRAVTALIYFAVIEWHQVDRVVPQLGGVQHTPEDALNVDWLHAKDGRGGDRWFPHYYQKWHEHWENRLDAVISIERVADPGPSADYLDWWYREAQRFLSPGAAFADPRGTQIPPEAYQRGSSQVPRRSQLPDMPDKRRRSGGREAVATMLAATPPCPRHRARRRRPAVAPPWGPPSGPSQMEGEVALSASRREGLTASSVVLTAAPPSGPQSWRKHSAAVGPFPSNSKEEECRDWATLGEKETRAGGVASSRRRRATDRRRSTVPRVPFLRDLPP